MKSILKYIKNNKLKFTGLILLDILFITSLLLILSNMLDPNLYQEVDVFNEIMSDVDIEDEEALRRLSEHSEEIYESHLRIRNIFTLIVLSILIVGNVIFALFFGLYLKSFNLSYILKFIGINFAFQGLLWIVFNIVISAKTFAIGTGIISESGMQSLILFVIIAYFAYFIGIILMVELRKKKFLKSTLFILKTRWLRLLGRYIAIIVIFWALLILTQAPFLNMEIGTIAFFAFFIIGSIVFIFYMTTSKLFMIESIIACESKKIQ